MHQSNVLTSNVFRRSVVASIGFVCLAIALVWIVGWVRLWLIDQSELADIEALIVEIEEEFEQKGRDAVIASRAIDDDPIWDDDIIFELLEEEIPLYALRTDDDDLVGGYGGLWPEEDEPRVWLDHPDIEDPLRATAFGLEDGSWATVARFVPEREHYWNWLIPQMTFALLLIGLPLSLVIGFFLSRGVLGRIEAISNTAKAISSGAMQSRVELQGTGDEFDRLSSHINDMLDQVAQLNRNIEAVSVGVAHDLKTPLANIGGRLELIRKDLNDPNATSDHVEAAEGYLDGLLRVFDALLRLGEVESGRRKAAFAPVDLSDLTSDMAASYEPLFDEAQKTLTTTVATGLRIDGDQELLQQMLSNLLENAIEHSRDAAQVVVELERSAHGPVLRIGDNGPGISPTDRAQLFERFYRGDQSRMTPGNGLGLSLVKAIAELHGAGIALLDGADGAVFEVRFPAVAKSYETV